MATLQFSFLLPWRLVGVEKSKQLFPFQRDTLLIAEHNKKKHTSRSILTKPESEDNNRTMWPGGVDKENISASETTVFSYKIALSNAICVTVVVGTICWNCFTLSSGLTSAGTSLQLPYTFSFSFSVKSYIILPHNRISSQHQWQFQAPGEKMKHSPLKRLKFHQAV